MCTELLQEYYSFLRMIKENKNNVLYTAHCGKNQKVIVPSASDEITELLKKHYQEKIEKLNKELLD